MGKEPKGEEHRFIIFCNEDMTPLEGVERSICNMGEDEKGRETEGGVKANLRGVVHREQVNGQQVDISCDEDGEREINLDSVGSMR
jgi:hypothetical protein